MPCTARRLAGCGTLLSTQSIRIPKVCSLSAFRRPLGRSGRCSRQKTTYGFIDAFFVQAGGASADARVGAGL